MIDEELDWGELAKILILPIKKHFLAKVERLQTENEKLERKIENMYNAIDGIQDDDYRMQVNDDIEARQKEDARTVEPMFKP